MASLPSSPRPFVVTDDMQDHTSARAGHTLSRTMADSRPGAQVQPELFVAYAEQDRNWVHGFLLPEIGLDRRSVLTPQDFRPGAAVVQEVERAVLTARFIVLVLSPALGMSQWPVFADLLASHDSLQQDPRRLIPLLLEPYELPLHLDFRYGWTAP
jgi:hypothetical protein